MDSKILQSAKAALFSTLIAGFATNGCAAQFVGREGLRIEVPQEIQLDEKLKSDLMFIDDVVQFALQKYGEKETKHYRKYVEQKTASRPLYILNVTHPFVMPDSRDRRYIYISSKQEYRKELPGGYAYFQSIADDLKDERDYYKSKGYEVFWRSTTNYNSGDATGAFVTPGFLALEKSDQAFTAAHEMCHEWNAREISGNYPSNLDESECMARGFLVSIAYFKEKNGPSSEEYQNAVKDFVEYNAYAGYVQNLSERLNEIYNNKKLSSSQKEKLRQKLFEKAKKDLSRSNINNAQLYDALPYAKNFHLYIRFHLSYNGNLDASLQILEKSPTTEKEALEYIKKNLGPYPINEENLESRLPVSSGERHYYDKVFFRKIDE